MKLVIDFGDAADKLGGIKFNAWFDNEQKVKVVTEHCECDECRKEREEDERVSKLEF